MLGTLTKREPGVVRHWFRRGPLLSTLRDEMDEMLADFFNGAGDGRLTGTMPPLDLTETETTVEVRVDVPGIKPGELDIQLAGNSLTISGQRKEEYEEKGRTLYRVERRSGSFSRSVALPSSVKEDHVDAQYHDGVLTITLQKSEEAKTRKIKIRT
jgi:HSP20 family protein